MRKDLVPEWASLSYVCVCLPIHTLFSGTLLPSAHAVRLGESCPDSCLMDPSVVAQYR